MCSSGKLSIFIKKYLMVKKLFNIVRVLVVFLQSLHKKKNVIRNAKENLLAVVKQNTLKIVHRHGIQTPNIITQMQSVKQKVKYNSIENVIAL